MWCVYVCVRAGVCIYVRQRHIFIEREREREKEIEREGDGR